MDKGLFELDSDDELMVMCYLIPKSRSVEVYVVGTPPNAMVDDRVIIHEEIRMENPFPKLPQCEMETEKELRKMEGVYRAFLDPDDSEEEQPPESHEESFYSDESNKDQDDDDLLFDMNIDKTVPGYLDDEEEKTLGTLHQLYLTVSSFNVASQLPLLQRLVSLLFAAEVFDIQPKEIRKAIGQTSGIVKPSRKLNRGRPYVQALLDELNARIASTANTLQNQQQQRINISSSSNLI
ncbi:hypothetical protein AgCh_016971 [Apium graveolens]